MKKGILKMLGVVVSLALLLMALPASVALGAVDSIVLSANSGGIGATINISGTGTAGQELHICLSSQNVDIVIAKSIDVHVTTYEWVADPLTNVVTGSYTANVIIPSALTDGANDLNTLHGGKYYFYVIQGQNPVIVKKAEFTLTGVASITADKTQGAVGTLVTITGEGFSPNEYVDLRYYHTTTSFISLNDSITSGNDQVGTNTQFSVTFRIPVSIYGDHTIMVVGQSSLIELSKTFKVLPSITLSAASGGAGTTVTVTGEGFDRLKYVDVYFGSTKVDDNVAAVRTDRTTSTGGIIFVFTIPAAAPPAAYTISMEDEINDTIVAEKPYTVIQLLNPAITVTPVTGNVGDTITISGTEFASNDTVTIYLDDVTTGITSATSATGTFSKTFIIPASADGSHVIKVQDTKSHSATKTITVTPKMTVDKVEGIAGTTVAVTGTGFAAGTVVTAKFNNVALAIGSVNTDAKGSFSFSFTVPAITTGTYNVAVTAGSTKEAAFTILEAAITITPNSGDTGTQVTVTGVNFPASSGVTITFGGTAVASGTAGSNGSFTVTFNVPAIAAGPYTITASSGAISKTASYSVTSNATITPTSGNVGTSVLITGTGFKANSPLVLTYDGVSVASGVTLASSATGAFGISFYVPASTGGAHTIAVSDGLNTKTFTFTMESTKPAAPQLLTPLTGSQQKGIITFDWSDVTDPSSPVIYTLQVAKDSSFTTTGIVLAIAGLTASIYTLPEGQTLVKLADNAPYYWRVTATDAAGNASVSSISTFNVTSVFPDWLMWVWIGLGVLVIFIFAIWIGKRMAYSSY